MPTIGFDTVTGFGGTDRTTADPHFAQTLGGTFTPTDSQEIFEVGFRGSVIPATFQIGVIRTDTLALVASGTVTSNGVDQSRNVVSITPVALTVGVTYATCWRCVSNGGTYLNSVGADRGIRNTSLTGADALANPFVNNGSALQSEFAIFATTQAASSAPTISAGTLSLLGVGV